MSDREAIMQSIRSALKASALALTDAQVIPTGDPGPRPPIPYLTVKVARYHDPVAGPGDSWCVYHDDGDKKSERQNVTASVDLVGYGRGALDWLEGLDSVMRLDSAARAELDLAGVGYRQATAVVDVSTALDTHIEYRATRSITLDYQRKSPQFDVANATTISGSVVYDSTSALTDSVSISVT